MKKLVLLFLFLFSALASFSQVIPKPNPSAVGIGYKRLLADSTLFIPTGGATPRLGATNVNRRSALFSDSVNKKIWAFYPSDSSWVELGAGGSTSILKQITKAAEGITKGQAVYVSGANGTNMLISKASNITEGLSSKTLGLVEATVATNGFVNVVTEGVLAGLNTSSATIGDPVWLGVNGNLIYGLVNKPFAPANLVFIGVVTRVNSSNGEIFIKVQNGFELRELHDVSAQSPSNNNGLFYNSTNTLWETKSIATALGYTPYDASNPSAYITRTGISAGTGLSYNSATGVMSTTITQYGNAAARAAISLTTTGTSGAATYSSTTGVFNIPNYGSALGNYVSIDGTQTITGAKTFSNTVTLTGTLGNGTYTYTLPSASGTLALTSNLSSYVPYSGATTSVNLGTNQLTAIQLNASASGGNVPAYSLFYNSTLYASISSTATYFQFNSNTSAGYLFKNSSGTDIFTITNAGQIGNGINTYTLPSSNGTLALTSQIPSLTNYVTLDGAQTITGAKTFSSLLTGTSATFSSTVQASAYRLTGMTAGSGALYYSSAEDRVTIANYNPTGKVVIEANGGPIVATFGGSTYNSDFVGTGRFSGNVLIGDIASGDNYKLQLIGTSQATNTFGQTYSGVAAYSQWVNSNGSFVMGLDAANGSTPRIAITSGGNVLVNTTTDNGSGAKLQVSGAATFANSVKSSQFNLSALNTAPASATATGTTGEIRVTSTFIYVCTATNTWVRASLSTW